MSDICGKPAGSFIAGASSWACVLAKGHEPSTHPDAVNGHLRGGDCCKHGKYVGKQCPQWPKCSASVSIAPQQDESLGAMIANWRKLAGIMTMSSARPQLPGMKALASCADELADFHARAMKVVEEWEKDAELGGLKGRMSALLRCATEMRKLFGKVTP